MNVTASQLTLWIGLIAPLIALFGVFVGWGLNQLGEVIKVRREDRRNLGKAIAELLDLRYRLAGMQKITEELRQGAGLSELEVMALQGIVDSFLPSWEETHKSYDEAVNALAPADPLLSFKLRSKDLSFEVLRKVRSATSENEHPIAATNFLSIEAIIVNEFVKDLEPVIQQLSKRHGWRTARKVKAHLAKEINFHEDFNRLLKPIMIS